MYYRTLGAKQIRLISRILGLESGLLDVFLAFGLGTNRIAAVFCLFSMDYAGSLQWRIGNHLPKVTNLLHFH